jgi:hypothetical protein
LVLRLLDLINVSAFLLPLHAGGTKIIAPKLLFATDAEPVFCLRPKPKKVPQSNTLVYGKVCALFSPAARSDAARLWFLRGQINF